MDRTGIALLGAIALMATGAVSMDEALRAVHLPTLALLFAFMVVAAQLRMSGFYAWATQRLGALDLRPPTLLGALTAVAGSLSAVFSSARPRP